MEGDRTNLVEVRGFYAKLVEAASKSQYPRLERIFELVPRFETPSADPVYL